MMIFGLLAMSFDLQLGRGALLNFGHVALFGVGAYVMAYTLNANFLPAPFNIIAMIPYPLTLLLAILLGGSLGLIMGLTTSRMRGTAFAFIALAIAMFIFNFFSENPDISGGETGLQVPTPNIIRTGPFYMLFVILAFIFLIAFLGTAILYIKKRADYTGLILITPVMVAFTTITLILGSNILGTVLVFIGFICMILLLFIERKISISDPLMYSENQITTGKVKSNSTLTTYLLPFIIIIVVSIGLVLSFATNIGDMFLLWVEDSSTFYFTIPVQFYLVLTCLVMIYVLVRRLIASPFGRMITAVAQNEERAQALGYNSYHAKIVVLVISGAIASLSGALYAPFIRTITPDTVLGVGVTIDAMLYTIIGGLATLLGPLLGTGIVKYSELNLVDFIEGGLGLPGRLWLVFLGIMYIGIVLFMPLGIVGSIGQKINSLKGNLRQMKLGRFEFGLKDSDFWIFGLLGAMGLILLLTEDARLIPLGLGIFVFLEVIVILLLIIFRRELWRNLKSFGGRLKLRLKAVPSRFRGGK
jgi:ABC-type branched-subunit amino acid transport system permease subunit